MFLREENLRAAFQMFDTDGSGKIDATEVKCLFEGEEFKGSVTKEQIDEIIQ
jgi:Ca2+-binding EF-hand superfamily protein